MARNLFAVGLLALCLVAGCSGEAAAHVQGIHVREERFRQDAAASGLQLQGCRRLSGLPCAARCRPAFHGPHGGPVLRQRYVSDREWA